LKACSTCKKEQPSSQYYADKSGKDGYRSDCKYCVKAKLKVNYQKKRATKLAIQKNWYVNNSNKAKQYAKQWRKDNPDKTKKYHQDYAEANPDKERVRSREKSSNRRAKLKGNGVFKLSPKDIKRLLTQPCINCGNKNNQTLDHVVPIARGGRHSIGNLQTLCLSCNVSKGTKTIMEWRSN